MITIPELIWITEEFGDPVEQPEGDGHSQHQHWKLQAIVQTTFHKNVTPVKAVLEEMGILKTENQNLFNKSL